MEVLLRQALGWDFRVQQLGRGQPAGEGDGSGSDDEDRPIVVELTEAEARLAGLGM